MQWKKIYGMKSYIKRVSGLLELYHGLGKPPFEWHTSYLCIKICFKKHSLSHRWRIFFKFVFSSLGRKRNDRYKSRWEKNTIITIIWLQNTYSFLKLKYFCFICNRKKCMIWIEVPYHKGSADFILQKRIFSP